MPALVTPTRSRVGGSFRALTAPTIQFLAEAAPCFFPTEGFRSARLFPAPFLLDPHGRRATAGILVAAALVGSALLVLLPSRRFFTTPPVLGIHLPMALLFSKDAASCLR